jgi:hypothetical protein
MHIQEIIFVEIASVIVSHGRTNAFPVWTNIFFELIESMGKSVNGINDKLNLGVRLKIWQIGEPAKLQNCTR